MNKEEVTLQLTIAAMEKMAEMESSDELCYTICTTYNNIYDNIISDK